MYKMVYIGCFYQFLFLSGVLSYTNVMSKTATTTFCPEHMNFVHKIFENHPSFQRVSTCCATRISNRFFLTEKQCIKKNIPKYITVRSCSEMEYQALNLYTPSFEESASLNGVILIEVLPVFEEVNQTNIYPEFFIKENTTKLNWEKKSCDIYGITDRSGMSRGYYDQWKTILKNSVMVRVDCGEKYQNTKIRNKTCYLFLEQNNIQFCDEDIGCPMLCDNKIIGIASLRYNWKTWALNSHCGSLDITSRYFYLDKPYTQWIINIIKN